MNPLYCYGENSFTFLAFQAMHSRGEVRRTLIPNLKRMGTGELFAEKVGEQPEDELWLFPNFGKTHGFGEPDAVFLAGDHSFWFEVETRVDLRRNAPAAEASLLQLLRFHFFHDALRRGGTRRQIGTTAPHRAIIGPTVADSGRTKLAVLRIKGHPVLRKLRARLMRSRPHYVLMAQSKAKGPGGSQQFDVALGELLNRTIERASGSLKEWGNSTGFSSDLLPSVPPARAFWYAYWEGDIRPKLGTPTVSPFLNGCHYISTRR